MTRAEEILSLLEVVPTKPGAAFKSQYRYSPGATVPMHLKRRKMKNTMMTRNRNAAYPKPWKTADKRPRDMSSTPLKGNDETPISRTR